MTTLSVSENAKIAHYMLEILSTVRLERARMKGLLYYIVLYFVYDKAIVGFEQGSSHVQSV